MPLSVCSSIVVYESDPALLRRTLESFKKVHEALRPEQRSAVAELIEVCTIPAILRAPAEDVADGAVLLRQALDNLQESR